MFSSVNYKVYLILSQSMNKQAKIVDIKNRDQDIKSMCTAGNKFVLYYANIVQSLKYRIYHIKHRISFN